MALTQVPIELSSTPGIVDNSNATAITIDSSENVIVGKTALEYENTAGHIFRNDGLQSSIRSGGNVADFNRLSDDGEIVRFSKDGTTVGSIQSRSGVVSTIILDPRTNGVGLTGSTNGLVPVDQTGSGTNNVELGSTSSRFNTLYLGNDIAHLDTAGNERLLYDRSSNLLGNAGTELYGAGIYLGGTGSANYLDDYEEGTWTPALAGHYGNLGTTFTQGTRNGVYTKIGNLVALGFEFTNAGVDAANNSDIVTVTGLPFSISGYGVVGSHAASAADSHVGGSWTSITGNTLGNLGNDGTKSDNWSWQTGANFSTSFSMRVTVIYRTTQ